MAGLLCYEEVFFREVFMRLNRLALAATAVLISACETTVPDTDTVEPTISAYILKPEFKLIASTEPSEDLEPGCPSGRNPTAATVQAYVEGAYGESVTYTQEMVDNAHFYSGSPPHELLLITRDDGGIFSMRAIAYAESNPDDITTATDFGSDDRAENADAFSLSNADEYGFSSSIWPRGDVAIFIYDKRPDGIGGVASMPGDVAIDGLGLQITPSSTGKAAHFYVEARDILGNGDQLVVHMLPASLCP